MSKAKEAGDIPIGSKGAKLKDVLRAVLTAPVKEAKPKKKRRNAKRKRS